MKHKKLLLYLAVTGVIAAALMAGAIGVRWAGGQLVNLALHASMEAMGALAAILTAIFLLLREREALGGKTLVIAMGFLGMGLLDGFHAASSSGNIFVLLHSAAVLAGGAWLALTWVPRPERFDRLRGWLPLAVAAGSVFFGFWAYMYTGGPPRMLEGGEFSAFAKAANLLSGALFIAAAVRLLIDFHRSGSLDFYIFACLALLLGLAGFTFRYSALWDGMWWFWHVLRLAAFSLVLGWVVSRLRSKRRQVEEESLEKGRHVALSADIGNALIAGSDLREALQGCAEAMVRHLDAAFARIWVLNDKDEILELMASAGMYTHIDGFHSRMDLWKYPYKIAVIGRERRPHLTNSVIGDPMVHDQEWAKREGMVAFAGYPLVFRDRLAGVMGLFAKKKLSNATLNALGSVADEITLGIERMRAGEALKKSEESFHGLVEESLAGAYIIQDGRLRFANQAMADIYGYSKEELYNFRVEDIVPPEDFPHENALNLRLLLGELPNIRYETHRLRKDGRIISLDMMRWMTEYEGRPAIIGTALDITDRKEAEEALKESEAKFRTLSQEALIGIYLVQDFRHVYVNPEFCRMLGYSEAEALGMDLFEIVHPEDRENAREGIASILSGRVESVSFQARWIRKGGGILDVEGSATFTAYRGRPALIGTALDITERKALEREKMDFLAMVTHDFKSPLTNILGYSELLLAKGPEKSWGEIRDMAGAISRSGRKLLGMVEDFLFHTKLASGAAVPEKTYTDLEKLLKGVSGEFTSQMVKKNLRFEVENFPDLPKILCDRKLVERAFSNLLQNAVTYTPNGGKITVGCELAVKTEGTFATISVSDTGPGIPAELQPRVFDKYFRCPTGSRGTGLGLAVVKAVADAHSGKVEMDCPEGVGCTFRMMLPVELEKERSVA